MPTRGAAVSVNAGGGATGVPPHARNHRPAEEAAAEQPAPLMLNRHGNEVIVGLPLPPEANVRRMVRQPKLSPSKQVAQEQASSGASTAQWGPTRTRGTQCIRSSLQRARMSGGCASTWTPTRRQSGSPPQRSVTSRHDGWGASPSICFSWSARTRTRRSGLCA
jgi:hypothetical protein